MKSPGLRLAAFSATFVALATGLAAHPGHDDGHEVTWDLGHLAAHPLATAGWLVAGGVVVGLTVFALRRRRVA